MVYVNVPEDDYDFGTTTGGGSSGSGTAPGDNTTIPPEDEFTSPSTAPLTGDNCEPNPTTSGSLAGTVQRYEDLPDPATNGAVYKVQGSTDTGLQSYYVRRNGPVWEEAVNPNRKNAIDPETMPWALVRLDNGEFEFAPFCWKPRRVGDGNSNPAPAFINRPIRDVFFYQNRLGFLTDESVVFSVSGDYGDFWRRTVLDYLDADSFSVAATTTDVALLDHAVPFNDGIMLFSAQRQFSLSNGEAGTGPSSVEMNPVTNYSMAKGIRPVSLGDLALFASDQGSYTAIQEYTRLDGRDSLDAAEITAHVPSLLPKGLSQLVPASGINAVFALARNSTTPDRVFAYQYYWDGDRKIISAWRRWAFKNAQAIHGTYLDGYLYLAMRRSNKLYIERMNMQEDAVSEGQDHLIYLDRQVSITGTYDGLADETTFTLPYEPDPIVFRALRTKTSSRPAESLIDGHKLSIAGNVVTIEGDESDAPLTMGELFRSSVKLSRQYALDYQQQPRSTGRLQLRSMRVNYSETPFFAAVVKPYGPNANIDEASATKVTQITAQKAGHAGHLLGTLPYETSSGAFTVAANAATADITLVNDTPFRSVFVSIEWEGLYYSR